MQGADEMMINELLTMTGSIIEKYNAIARETGRNFNIFEIAQIEEKEVIVCRVLTELLNPKGRHGQGGAYLKLFLRDCLGLGDMISEINTEDMRVMPEHFTDNGRLIDIVIEGGGKFIPIEAKLYAGDQSMQCYDYCMYARTKDSRAKIVYLTLFGSEPSPDSKGNLSDDDIVLLSFDNHILRWLEKCLALPDTIRKTPIREILIQFISAIKKITNNLEDKPKMELTELLSKSSQQIRNAKAISDALDDCRYEIVTKFITAFHEKFGANFDRQPLDSDFVKWKRGNNLSVEIAYMFDEDVKRDVSVVFFLSASTDHTLLAWFGMMRKDETAYFRDKDIIKELKAHYGVEEEPSDEYCILYDYISFDDDWINLSNFNGSCDNYLKLFDPDTFNEILNSTLEQASAVLTKIRRP